MVFGNVYGMSLWQRGLCFLGLFVGMLFAIMSDPLWRRVYGRLEKNHEATSGRVDDPQPEWRLPPGIFFLWLDVFIADDCLQQLLAVLLSPLACLSSRGRFIRMSIGLFQSLEVRSLEGGKLSSR